MDRCSLRPNCENPGLQGPGFAPGDLSGERETWGESGQSSASPTGRGWSAHRIVWSITPHPPADGIGVPTHHPPGTVLHLPCRPPDRHVPVQARRRRRTTRAETLKGGGKRWRHDEARRSFNGHGATLRN